MYTNEAGGILDDLIVSRLRDSLYVVSNAGCREKDLKHLRGHAGKWDVEIMEMDAGLLALQGIEFF